MKPDEVKAARTEGVPCNQTECIYYDRKAEQCCAGLHCGEPKVIGCPYYWPNTKAQISSDSEIN